MGNARKKLANAKLTERLNENTKGVYILSATPFDDDGSIKPVFGIRECGVLAALSQGDQFRP